MIRKARNKLVFEGKQVLRIDGKLYQLASGGLFGERNLRSKPLKAQKIPLYVKWNPPKQPCYMLKTVGMVPSPAAE
ncbi:hypothetical protein H5410_047645 [Solanum commersonii]|uniref:Uncharacterized protein n=1 Tax=Solanum commersonii TaxID=4109 RepID=A0A9J5XFR3_SOLCO|nr:hypothetical protein H5410_047645 [Solanum commersonii]